MSPMPWFRVYSEILDDRKIKRICKKTGHSKALIVGTWICLLALANESSDRGILNISDNMPYDLNDLEDETGLPIEILAQILDEFKSMGMLTGNNTLEIINWDKRQFKSDDISKRVRKHREKRSNETLQKRSKTVIDTDTDKESDKIRKEEVLKLGGAGFYIFNLVGLDYKDADTKTKAGMLQKIDKHGETALCDLASRVVEDYPDIKLGKLFTEIEKYSQYTYYEKPKEVELDY